ncbi:MAG: sugar porter family MFS transporter [Bacteroidetes bacterium]|nr:sugar porter family MFS transporter [Bacteroidota bacterium]
MTSSLGQNMGYVVFLSVVAALGGFLFGYDTAVISGTIDQVAAQYHLDPMQQGWFVGCALVGSILGVLVAGVLGDRFGRKRTMIVSAVLFTVSGVGCAVSGNFGMLIVNRIIGGVGIGVVSIISPLYISEVAITKYRGRLVSLYQLAITVGFLGAYLVNYELLKVAAAGNLSGGALLKKIFVAESWRGMLGMESLPAFLFFLIIFFIPESPRWLLMRRQESRALAIMCRIYRDPRDADQEANEVRWQLQHGERSDWRLLLKPAYFRALMIGVAIAILGQFMGVNAVLYYGPTIFRNSGLSDGDSLLYQVLVGVVNALTTVLALLIIDKVGRKKLVYYGVSGMISTLLLIALYFLKGQDWHIPAGMLLTFFLSYIFFCAVSICAVIWVLLSEMYPTAVRGIAMSIAGFSLWIGTYLIGQLTPWMLSALSPAGTFALFALMCLPYVWIVWRLVPETAGKSLEEIERMWER